jgi:hypothetical protein
VVRDPDHLITASKRPRPSSPDRVRMDIAHQNGAAFSRDTRQFGQTSRSVAQAERADCHIREAITEGKVVGVRKDYGSSCFGKHFDTTIRRKSSTTLGLAE